MSTVRVYFDGERMDMQFHRGTVRTRERVLRAIRGASQRVAEETLSRGRADIASAGNFGPRWQRGLDSRVTEGGGNIRVATTHSVVGFNVHQYGATIRGKPLLAIPLSFARDAQGVRARDFPGKLFRVDRKNGGAPLLLSVVDGQPKYVLKESVTIPKRFHVVEIAREAASRIGDFYNRIFRDG